jgi:chromosome segregation ATPase
MPLQFFARKLSDEDVEHLKANLQSVERSLGRLEQQRLEVDHEVTNARFAGTLTDEQQAMSQLRIEALSQHKQALEHERDALREEIGKRRFMKRKFDVRREIRRGTKVEAEEHAKTIMRIEVEHPSVEKGAEMIATDHVREFPGVSYYDALEETENKLRSESHKKK